MGFFDFIGRFRKSSRPGGPPDVEKRRAERLHVPGTLDVYFWADANVRYGDGELRDISAVGIRFASDSELEPGTMIELKVHFPRAFRPKESVSMKARVVRCYKHKGQERYRIGCEFTQIDPASSAKIEEFLSWVKALGGAQNP